MSDPRVTHRMTAPHDGSAPASGGAVEWSPSEVGAGAGPGAHVPFSRQIFCNRNLRLDRIRFVGFDMDYTLAIYEEAMEHLQAEMVLDRLVERYGYPRAVLSMRYEQGFGIRGLAVDRAHGNVFKMDAHRFVGRVWHGGGPITRERRREIYKNRRLSPADPGLVMVDTLFSLPEISLYCQLVRDIETFAPAGSPRPTFERLWNDLREAMDSLHRDGTLKRRIVADLPRYIRRDPSLGETLHRFRSAGKKLFIATNSEPSYTEAVMRYLLDGQQPAYPSWRDYFDVILTSALKPMFFGSSDPFVAIDETDGSFRPAPSPAPLTSFRRGVMYTGGNVVDLNRLIGALGDDVLYVGDHIYGDILRSKRSTTWRTALVVPELEGELERMQSLAPELAEIDRLEESRIRLGLERTTRAFDGVRDARLAGEIRRLSERIRELERQTADRFNPHWGPLFRDRAEMSAFGSQVEDYACIYTSRVSNFRLYSPEWYFRSPRKHMAHELSS